MHLPPIQHLDQVDSTNEHAFRELAGGRAVHLQAWTAASQTAGRGRRGQTWHGQPGDSLMLSILLAGETQVDLPSPSLLSMATALAIVDAIPSPDVRVDWPNDLVSARSDLQRAGSDEAPKLAGILIEARDFNPAVPRFVVGIGVNVAGQLPAELLTERPACTLAQLGVDITVAQLAGAIQSALSTRAVQAAHDPSATCAAYLGASGLQDAMVEIAINDRVIQGRLTAIAPAGLTLVSEDGARRHAALEHVQAIKRASIY